MLRELVFLALVGGAGFGAWNTFPETSRSALNWAVNEAHARVCKPEAPSANQPAVTKAQPVVLQTAVSIPDDRFLISKETLAAITCGPWDVSEDGMEAILQEMIRREQVSGADRRSARNANRSSHWCVTGFMHGRWKIKRRDSSFECDVTSARFAGERCRCRRPPPH